MNRTEKETAVKSFTDRLEKSKAIMLANYQGLTVRQMTELRGRLRGIKSTMQVMKNRLAKMAFKARSIEGVEGYLKGPTLVVLSDTDPVGQAKILVEYAKGNGNLKLKAGIVEGKVLVANQVRVLAALPSREVLLAILLGSFNAPASNLARVLLAVPRKLVGVLDAIGKNKKHEA